MNESPSQPHVPDRLPAKLPAPLSAQIPAQAGPLGAGLDESAFDITFFDEFSFIEADAARLGVADTRQPVRRAEFVSQEASGQTSAISGLVWGDGPAEYVFLHGAGLHAHSWDSTALVLGRPALALDLPGHGDSRWRADADYSPAALAGPVASVIASQTGRITLVGQSLGGLTAMPVASALERAHSDTPEAGGIIERLVIVDVTPGHRVIGDPKSRISEFIAGPESYPSRSAVIDRALEFGMGRVRTDLVRGVLQNTRVREDGRVVFKHHLASLPVGSHASFDPATLWQDLQKLTCPILLVRGTRGILTEEHVEEFLQMVPGSSAVTIEAGHNVQRDAPLELANSIREFAGR